MAGLVIKPRSRLFHGHDWVYQSEVLKTFGNPQDGEVVSLKDSADRSLGSAIFNSKSQIVARRISRQKQDLDADFFQRRIQQALQYRVRRGIDPQLCRLVWSESDAIPGLILDRYGPHVVMQTLTLAMDRRKELIADTVRSLLQPASIVERNESSIRRAEGLEPANSMLFGEPPAPFPIRVGGIEFEVDLVRGQKTGFYLDQLENYAKLAPFAQGRRVLDCFSNQGAFALTCAKAGAREVVAVENSAECVDLIQSNARRNSLQVQARAANVFDVLKEYERADEKFDLVILDPPSFTKSKGKLNDALRGYKEIHLRALRLLSPEGLLATYCCSHHVSAETFKEVINEATVDAKKTLRQLDIYSQGADHPIIPTLPETEYLKGYLFELAPGR
jgi:23S rRNA (cytosine1962-C5)-methyltransferase